MTKFHPLMGKTPPPPRRKKRKTGSSPKQPDGSKDPPPETSRVLWREISKDDEFGLEFANTHGHAAPLWPVDVERIVSTLGRSPANVVLKVVGRLTTETGARIQDLSCVLKPHVRRLSAEEAGRPPKRQWCKSKVGFGVSRYHVR